MRYLVLLSLLLLHGCASLCQRDGWSCPDAGDVFASVSDSVPALPQDCPLARSWQREGAISAWGLQRSDVARICERAYR